MNFHNMNPQFQENTTLYNSLIDHVWTNAHVTNHLFKTSPFSSLNLDMVSRYMTTWSLLGVVTSQAHSSINDI